MDVQKSVIFTSVPELGVPFDQDIYQYLKDCFREDLYVIFLFSRSFYNSNVCIAETGAAWATNQKYSNVVIDMGFGGIDKPINNSQLGVSLADLEAEDLQFKLKSMIKNALTAIGYEPMPMDIVIENAINKAIEEYRSQLVAPLYYPQRRFLATPVCPECKSQMELKVYNGKLKFCCLSRTYDHTIDAEII